MLGNPLFDIGSVMARLRPIIREEGRPRTPADFAAALPEFMALPRYSGAGGADLLLQDLEAAIADLPIDAELPVQDRQWARLLLGLDQPAESITSRRRDLGEGNGSARKFRDRFVVQSVLHRLQLLALDAPPVSVSYDSGFEVLFIHATMLVRTRSPLNPRHVIDMQLRTTRGGQRLIPLCYGAIRPFSSYGAQVRGDKGLDITYIGSSTVPTRNAAYPTHFFWFSQPPAPGAIVTIRVVLSETHDEVWTETQSRLLLITGDTPVISIHAAPPKAFERIDGYRFSPNSLGGTLRFTAGSKTKHAARIYRPRGGIELTAFELRCFASDKCLDAQRQSMRE
jgi:hypothetical protein